MSFSTRETRRSSISFEGDEGLTEQHHKKSCDMHVILRQAEKTGVLSHVNAYGGQYMDMPSGVDFHQAQNIIAEATQMFETVPADIRKKFGNDPAEYLDFMQNEENRDKMIAMGLDTSHLPPLPEPVEAPAPKPEPAPQAE